MTSYKFARHHYELVRKFIVGSEVWPSWDRLSADLRKPWIEAAGQILREKELKNA